MSINRLVDWYDYYDMLNHLARKSHMEHIILSYISKYSPARINYVSEIRQEIIDRAVELE
ncbi:hypothetical protein ACR2TD_001589 [Klebsiella variicola]